VVGGEGVVADRSVEEVVNLRGGHGGELTGGVYSLLSVRGGCWVKEDG
jgi:hypothetical protein